MVRIQGEQATALALERMGIPVPGYIHDKLKPEPGAYSVTGEAGTATASIDDEQPEQSRVN